MKSHAVNIHKKLNLLFILISLTTTGIPQSVSTLMGARGAGVGYASATLSDEWSIHNNIGGLSGVDHPAAAFAYDARPAFSGADRMAAALSMPLRTGVCGLGIFRFGDDVYSEQIISAGYGSRLGLTSLGIKLNYVQYRAEGYPTRHAMSLNFGGVTHITPKLSVGAYIVNLNQPKISSASHERLPTKLIAGISFKPTEKFLLAGEVEKDLDYSPLIRAGAEYAVYKKIVFRTGFNLHPGASFMGIGFHMKRMKIDYAMQYSTALSFSHVASAIYRIDPVKKVP